MSKSKEQLPVLVSGFVLALSILSVFGYMIYRIIYVDPVEKQALIDSQKANAEIAHKLLPEMEEQAAQFEVKLNNAQLQKLIPQVIEYPSLEYRYFPDNNTKEFALRQKLFRDLTDYPLYLNYPFNCGGDFCEIGLGKNVDGKAYTPAVFRDPIRIKAIGDIDARKIKSFIIVISNIYEDGLKARGQDAARSRATAGWPKTSDE